MADGKMTGAIQVLAGLLQVRTGQFLSDGRMWRLETSLKPLLRTHGLANLDELVDRLLTDGGGKLADDIVDALLNNETSFYRDQHVFQSLVRTVLPHIAQTRQDKVLRIWSAGCSTGQEAYSLAMSFRKEEALWEGWRIQILATDISNMAVARAKSGLYSQIDVQRGLAINDLLRWFEPHGDEWRISQELRSMVDFRVDNLFECTVPSGKYDLILCRNVLLYFSAEMRRQVFERVAQYCAPGGHLVLGAGETVIGQSDDFSTSPIFRGIYQRTVKPADNRDVQAGIPESRRNNAA
jgi:chemotaxis protein methyltransferase CheR